MTCPIRNGERCEIQWGVGMHQARLEWHRLGLPVQAKGARG